MSRSPDQATSELIQIFPGDSEMAARTRAFDWSQHVLGSSAAWPQNLRIALSICLTSGFPTLLWWGPNLTVLYNDAYIPFLGETKHPHGAQAIEVAAQLAWHFEVAQLQKRLRCTTIRRATRSGIQRHWMRLSDPTRRRSNSSPRSIAQPARPRCAAMRASRRRCRP